MASVRSCVSVKPAAGPARYRSARVGAASLEPTSLRISASSSSSSLGPGADGCGRGVGCAASISGRGVAVARLVGDGWRARRRGGREVVAECSASLEGVRHGAAAAAVPSVPALPERAKVVALVAAVMLLCNADRVVMSVAVVPLAAQHGWSSSFVGIVQSSFLWGYVFSSMVGGALADRYGGKKVMAGAAALWSLATFLTPWAASQSATMLLAVRVLFGVAEGVAFPTMSTFLPKWFPTHERATAVGLSMGGFHLGNVKVTLLTAVL
uniref:Major facilitator superfamily (MFS) profile domain-containing protein n=1 Tax=Aegilops tauschii subsp. strangulata TaxID=200361 RepID=A0A452Z877_AEGTS